MPPGHISTFEKMTEQLGHIGVPLSLTRFHAKIIDTLPKALRVFFCHGSSSLKTKYSSNAQNQDPERQTNQQLMPNNSSDSSLDYFALSSRGKSHSSNGRGGLNSRGGSGGRGGASNTTRAETNPPLDKRPRLRCEHCFNTKSSAGVTPKLAACKLTLNVFGLFINCVRVCGPCVFQLVIV